MDSKRFKYAHYYLTRYNKCLYFNAICTLCLYQVSFLQVSVTCNFTGLSRTLYKYLLPVRRTEQEEGRYHYL